MLQYAHGSAKQSSLLVWGLFVSLCMLMAAGFYTPSYGARVILSETFNDDVPDTVPNSADSFSQSKTINPDTDPATIVVTGGEFADPFGVPGNQSMLLYNPRGTSQMAVVWRSMFDDDPAAFRNGSIEFDLYMANPTAGYWSYLDARVGYGDASRSSISPSVGTDSTVWNSYRIQSNEATGEPFEDIFDDGYRPDKYRDNGDPADLFGPDRSVRVKYEFDGSGNSFADPPIYTLSLNGTPIRWGVLDDPNRFWMFNSATFQFAPGINIFGFWTDASASGTGTGSGTDSHTGNVYIDNLVVTNFDLPPLSSGPDLNNDGTVDASDAGIMFGAWGSSDPLADLTQDGIVDAADAGVMFGAWTGDSWTGDSLLSSVPEPTLGWLSFLGGIGLLRGRSRPVRQG